MTEKRTVVETKVVDIEYDAAGRVVKETTTTTTTDQRD